jgi:RNA recognition motif-containing protein
MKLVVQKYDILSDMFNVKKGTAVVEYKNASSAVKAIEEYDGIHLFNNIIYSQRCRVRWTNISRRVS